MKRNQSTVRQAHHKARGKRSRYAEKQARGQQMYGPGCCAHRIRLDYWSGDTK